MDSFLIPYPFIALYCLPLPWTLSTFAGVYLSIIISYYRETTLGGSMDSVVQLIDYVGWLSVIAIRLESNSTLLLHFILDFYEKVVYKSQIYDSHFIGLWVLNFKYNREGKLWPYYVA